MMRKVYNNKGITLVVLIVTIIILLILAGVTFSFILNENGVINKSQLAVNEYEKAAENEKQLLNSIDSYMETIIDVVKVGDYVQYDPTKNVDDISKLSYTSNVGSTLEHGNGKSVQIFTANKDIKWIVLNVNKEEGILELISEEPIKTDSGKNLFFKGNIGYLYFEEEIQRACSIYGYGYGADTNNVVQYEIGNDIDGVEKRTLNSGARSISLRDINKFANISDIEDAYKEIDEDYGTVENNKQIYYPTVKTSRDNGRSDEVKSGFKYTYYEYWGEDYIDDNKLCNILLNGGYWIPNRCSGINYDEDLFNVDFCGFCVDADSGEGLIHGLPICEGNEYRIDQFGDEGYGIRPIVKINKNMKIDKSIECDGSTQKPWILK